MQISLSKSNASPTYWAGMTFILHGRQSHIEERPEAFELTLRHGNGPYLSFNWVNVSQHPGGRLNIKMSSYQYRDSHVNDKTVSPTVLSLTWESPYLGKTVFILRRGPDSTWTRRPSPLPTAMLVWNGVQPGGLTNPGRKYVINLPNKFNFLFNSKNWHNFVFATSPMDPPCTLPTMKSFHYLFVVNLNKCLNKSGKWTETHLRSCDVTEMALVQNLLGRAGDINPILVARTTNNN